MPVYFIIAPCCMAGAFMLRAGEGGEWPMLNTVALTTATVMQGVALTSALFFVEMETIDARDEIAAMANYEEVEQLEQERAELRKKEDKVTHWDAPGFPMWAKACLLCSVIMMSASCYIYMMFPQHCFRKFVVTNSVANDLPGGKAYNVVKDLGWFLIGVFVCGVVLSR